MNIHLCCADIYLENYLNLDIVGRVIKQGENNPNLTNLENYYKDREIGKKREIIIDKKMNILKFPWKFKDNSIDNIVMICALEHFTPNEAKKITDEIYRILKPNGKAMIDIPNVKEQIELYYDSDPEWCMELIFCNQKNIYSMHHWGYTKKTLKKLLGEDKYEFEFGSIVKHSYPVIGVTAIKK